MYLLTSVNPYAMALNIPFLSIITILYLEMSLEIRICRYFKFVGACKLGDQSLCKVPGESFSIDLWDQSWKNPQDGLSSLENRNSTRTHPPGRTPRVFNEGGERYTPFIATGSLSSLAAKFAGILIALPTTDSFELDSRFFEFAFMLL